MDIDTKDSQHENNKLAQVGRGGRKQRRMICDLLNLNVASKGEGLQVWGDCDGIVRGGDVGGKDHAVGMGRGA